MAVDTCHPQYEDMRSEWCKMRDVVVGNRAIQKNADKYLKALSGQTPDEYDTYHRRGVFFNATSRVIDTMSGLVFRKKPVFEIQPIKELTVNIDLAGMTLEGLCERLMQEQLEVSRCGILVDFPAASTAGLTQVAAERLNLRPYATLYTAESIINWMTETVGGLTRLSKVVLKECGWAKSPEDEFEVVAVEKYRVLDLMEGKYRQRVFVKEKGKEAVLQSEVFPIMNGKAVSEIPFVFFGVRDNSPDVTKPVFLDLADLNISHWRNVVDHEHGIHLTGLPTPVITGVNDDKTEFKIGSGVAWVLSSEQAKAFYLEFTGQGLEALRKAILDKKDDMAALGARILSPDKAGVEAADTLTQKRAGENSVLASIAIATSKGMTKVLELLRDWSGASGNVSVTLNTDYNVIKMSAQEITAVLQAVLNGQLSSQSFYETLIRGEVISTDRTFEEEQALIAEGGALDVQRQAA